MNLAIPILPARDLEETRDFYLRLGFEVAGWWPQFGGYAAFKRDELEVHFFLFRDLSPLENYGQCYWRVDDADALYREYSLANLPRDGHPRLVPIESKPWGMREFAVVDPNGNLVRIGQALR
jgi:catechol 2,3-dioxygenase-like lactoylglutathione lyase family enzyme